ncbi:MAG: class I SAM-dependent methyltransferase [Deltaproteobacteria bacterium]|nr:class I SAM-dependent methyltransferase [Deltaproteobacteria bacterium]MBW2382447.1 class I SAM-dependent methyltransferase [Deltaproteobacteria bacterium]MBW2698036.1 class I SAM-dependent methyltransferase [Deltaproteobacteria bacterium]
MSRLLFTGERLHADNPLFGVDLVRHRAAYAHATRLAQERTRGRILDLGCGTGYGTAELAAALPGVFAVDRISPDPAARHARAHFIRADVGGIPLPPASFDMVVSFQVIEHLEDPSVYLDTIARILRPDGLVLISTPNRLESDNENPFHVREYTADELALLLRIHFGDVEMLGVTATREPRAYYDARLARIRKIVRIDPFGLRKVLPRKLIDWLFGRLAVVIRRGIQRSDGLPEVTLADFPIGPARDDCLDLLAVCRTPKSGSS